MHIGSYDRNDIALSLRNKLLNNKVYKDVDLIKINRDNHSLNTVFPPWYFYQDVNYDPEEDYPTDEDYSTDEEFSSEEEYSSEEEVIKPKEKPIKKEIERQIEEYIRPRQIISRQQNNQLEQLPEQYSQIQQLPVKIPTTVKAIPQNLQIDPQNLQMDDEYSSEPPIPSRPSQEVVDLMLQGLSQKEAEENIRSQEIEEENETENDFFKNILEQKRKLRKPINREPEVEPISFLEPQTQQKKGLLEEIISGPRLRKVEKPSEQEILEQKLRKEEQEDPLKAIKRHKLLERRLQMEPDESDDSDDENDWGDGIKRKYRLPRKRVNPKTLRKILSSGRKRY